MKRFKKVSNSIDFVSKETPFVLETDEFPMLTEMSKRSSAIPTELIQRKAKLRIYIDTLGVPQVVRERLIALSGPRYDEKTGSIILVGDSQPNRDLNIAHVYKTAGNLLHEAWKADLNYVAYGDNLPPHEQIQRLVELEEEAKAQEETLNPESFKRAGHYTLFRVASYPQPEFIQKGRDAVKALVQELSI